MPALAWLASTDGSVDRWNTRQLEPRAGIAIRLSPVVAARVLVGFDALVMGAVQVGAMFELHSRSYDGFFVRPTNANAK